jgi:peptidoglycan/LPS O-acetylase OafA/YrhL
MNNTSLQLPAGGAILMAKYTTRLVADSPRENMSSPTANRLVEVDTLRGLAAIAVVFFHFTTRFGELYPGHSSPSISFPVGHYGVNLFFIISGFVIFMTLERTQKSMDFVVSRFSRLFPTYWVAIFLTLAITHLLGLPGKLVGLGTAIANMTMVHGIFSVPHVDGVYWTLEVELLFYCGMFLLYRLEFLDKIHVALSALMLLRLVYWLLEHGFGISLPWIVFRLMILQYISWFALGIAVYLLTNRQSNKDWRPAAACASLAIATIMVCESIVVALLGVVFASTVYLAANGRLRMLRSGPLVWFGTISYPLYLVHENIGWAVMLRMLTLNVPIDIAIISALIFVLLLASALTRWAEQPAMLFIRTWYNSKKKTRST